MGSNSLTTIVMVRHGETEWNQTGRVQGQTESDLTKLGQKQAEGAGKRLASMGTYDALYSSDMRRTKHTAEAITRHIGLEAQIIPELREMDFGALEGLLWDEVSQRVPEAQDKLWGDSTDPSWVVPGGESRDQMHQRTRSAVEKLARKHPGQKIIIVSHGGVIGFFLRSILDIPFDVRPSFSTRNGSINVFTYNGHRFKLKLWGLDPLGDNL